MNGILIDSPRLRVIWLFALASLSLTGCGGLSNSSSPYAPSATTTASLNATFSSIQSQIFTPRCIACHGTVTNGGLDLSASVAFTNLVNTGSSQTSLLRVAPGDPDSSYLIHKLEGRAGIIGNRMPQGGPFLAAAELDTIKAWITAGALNN